MSGKFNKRFIYKILSFMRMLAALTVLGLFVTVYLSPLRQWSELRTFLFTTQFSAILQRGGIFFLTTAVVLVIAVLCGRWYCSFLCPFGTVQETVWRVARPLLRKKQQYIATPFLRFLMPLLPATGVIFAVFGAIIIMDPISTLGRGTRSALALWREGFAILSQPVIAVSLAVLLVVVVAALKGRRFCDWCPIGVTLGILSRVAPFGMKIDREKCVSCGACEASCPMSCIDAKAKELDRGRCVMCMGCASQCATGALSYGPVYRAAAPAQRRSFIRSLGGWTLGLLSAGTYLGSGSLRRAFFDRGRGKAAQGGAAAAGTLILPPGGKAPGHFTGHCISCQACAAACPAGIINTKEAPHPTIDYSRGYCQFNCTECSKACPTFAIIPLSLDKKHRTRIALSSMEMPNCVVVAKGQACGACAEVCPTHAIQMKEIPGEHMTAPDFDDQYCIGCGACFNVCPAQPRVFTITPVAAQTETSGTRPYLEDEEAASPANASSQPFPF